MKIFVHLDKSGVPEVDIFRTLKDDFETFKIEKSLCDGAPEIFHAKNNLSLDEAFAILKEENPEAEVWKEVVIHDTSKFLKELK